MAKATIYRMVPPAKFCGFGVAALILLKLKRFEIEEHKLTSRAETDAFKAKHNVATTPLIFIDGEKIGGFTDLKAWLRNRRVQ